MDTFFLFLPCLAFFASSARPLALGYVLYVCHVCPMVPTANAILAPPLESTFTSYDPQFRHEVESGQETR
jgi:hypothetical protein